MFIFIVCALSYVVCVVCICQHLEWFYLTREKVEENFPQLCTNSIVFFCLFVAILYWLLFNNYSSSLRASSPIWASEVNRGRTREREAKPRGAAPRSCVPLACLLFTTSPNGELARRLFFLTPIACVTGAYVGTWSPNGLSTQRPWGGENNSFSKIQIVGQRYRDKTTSASKTWFNHHCFAFQSLCFFATSGL